MLDALILVEDLDDMRDLIDKVVKINNRIYQQKWANKGHNKQVQMHKSPQQTSRQWYERPKPINLSSIKEVLKSNSRNRS